MYLTSKMLLLWLLHVPRVCGFDQTLLLLSIDERVLTLSKALLPLRLATFLSSLFKLPIIYSIIIIKMKDSNPT